MAELYKLNDVTDTLRQRDDLSDDQKRQALQDMLRRGWIEGYELGADGRSVVPAQAKPTGLKAFMRPGGPGEVAIPTLMEAVGTGLSLLTGPLQPVTAPALEAGGATLGLTMTRLLQGKKPTGKELMTEAALSAAPGIGVRPAAALVRKGASRLKAGAEEAAHLAARRLEQIAPQLLHPRAEQEIGNLFAMVRRSGQQLSPERMGGFVRSLTDDEFKQLRREVLKISVGPVQARDLPLDLGERIARNLDRMRLSQPTLGLDIGFMQQLSSEIGKRASGRSSNVKDVLSAFEEAVEDTISNSLRIDRQGGKDVRPLLSEARREWGIHLNQKKLTRLMTTSPILTYSGKQHRITLNFGKLREFIENPKTDAARALRQSLRQSPEGEKEILDFMKRIQNVDIDTGTKFGIGALERVVNLVMGMVARPAARERFARLVFENRNVLGLDALANLANATRRQLVGPGVPSFTSEGGQFLQQGQDLLQRGQFFGGLAAPPAQPPQR